MHQAGLAAAAALPADPAETATPTEATPEGEQATPEAVTTEDSFTRLDPNAIPAELQPYYKSMQADHTRKTQEAAPYRRLAEETGLDVDGLKQAAELYTALQDPTQIVQFHSELTAALREQGLTPAEASAAATQHIQETQSGTAEQETAWSDDPDERRLQELEAKLAHIEESSKAEAEARQREQMQMSLVAEMNRQEAFVREAHPDWQQDDVDAVYELSAFYGGNLVDAAARYDDIVSARVARILNGKGAAATGTPAPLPVQGGAVTKPMDFGGDLDAAHKAAMKLVRSLPQ